MKLSLNWLKDFVTIPPGYTAEKLGEKLTMHTAEVEEVMDQTTAYDKMMIGKVLKIEPHPNADKLKVCKVDIGETKPAQIVCGGVNLKENMLVPIAIPGAWVKWHGQNPSVELEEVKIRGEKSFGMICAGEEIDMEPDNTPDTKEPRIKDLTHLNAKVGTPLATALKKDDAIFDFDNKSLTHRPDLWGHYGMARELAALLKNPLKPYDPLTKFTLKEPTKKVNIVIKDKKISPQFSGCIVSNVQIKPSPEWIQKRLEAVGIPSINNIVDITNYVMLELGQPMHAYDRQIVGTDTLEVRFAQKGEILETIDHKKRKLRTEDPVVTNGKGVMGLAGIMGGANSEINDQTTEVIFEAANWDPVITRKTSTHHGLRSDASQRFEKGLDPDLTEKAVRRAIVLLLETCPDAKLETKVTTVGTWKFTPAKITVDPDVVNNKIGIKITTMEMMRILKSLEFQTAKKERKFEVTVPSHRSTGDVDIEEDIIEEVARIYGYDQVPVEMPHLPINLPTENEERFHKHAARNILANILGFTEVMAYSFYNEELYKKCGLEDMRHIKVLNPLSSDQTHMRVSLVPGMLKAIAQNSKLRDKMELFEIGRTYQEVGEFMPLEEKWLLMARACHCKGEIFYRIKGAFEAFQKHFRAPSVSVRDCHTPPPYAHPKKCAEIMMRGESIGYIFALHPAVAQAFELEHKVVMTEVNFTKLVAHDREPTTFEALPKFPNMPFDVSLLIDRKKPIADVEKALRRADPHKLIQQIKLFDIYEGDNIPKDKKSLAFSVELRHADRTLTDEEFQATQKAVFEAIKKLGGEVRTG